MTIDSMAKTDSFDLGIRVVEIGNEINGLLSTTDGGGIL